MGKRSRLSVSARDRLRVGHEQIELGGPEAVDLGTERGHSRWVDGVEALAALLAGGDETGLLEGQEVLRDGRPGDRERGGELGHRARTARQQLEQPAPVRLGGCSERVPHEEHVSDD